jgi:cation transport protein ChaC
MQGVSEPTWVFGYGSLIWRQDFPFREIRRARIDGWVRRLWQGSHDHRGLPDDPGRVATIVRSAGESCHGCALLVEPEVFEHLDHREKNGYERVDLTIHLINGAVAGTTYIAPVDNHAFLGPADVADIAAQVRRCRGPSGSNVEYVVELARALRDLDIHDAHIFAIEAALREGPGQR